MTIRHEPTLIEQAKKMYMEYKNATEIFNETGLPIRTVHYYVQRHWRAERDIIKNDYFSYVAENKRLLLNDITDSALLIIDKSLKKLVQSDENLKVHQIKAISEILESIDKIIKLDDNRPTEIHATTQPTTIIELKERLRVDPFLSLEEKHEEAITVPSITTTNSSSNASFKEPGRSENN
jgi:hypothetical protein